MNPGNIVNFCFGLGASYHLTTFNAGPNEPSINDIGFNAKIISLGVNILTPLGLFYPGFDLHINAVLGLNKEKQYNVDDKRTQRGFVYNVPRVTLYWFPTFPPAK